jgi:hypothetical protein
MELKGASKVQTHAEVPLRMYFATSECIINDAGRQVAHKKHEKFKYTFFWSNLDIRRFNTHVLKVYIN